MPPKRPVTKIEPSPSGAPASKRPKPWVKQEPRNMDSADNAAAQVDDKEELTERFISLFADEQYKDGISNTQLQSIFGNQHYTKLVPIINALSQKSRINMSMLGDGDELVYTLVPEEIATKFAGLDPSARLV